MIHLSSIKKKRKRERPRNILAFKQREPAPSNLKREESQHWRGHLVEENNRKFFSTQFFVGWV